MTISIGSSRLIRRSAARAVASPASVAVMIGQLRRGGSERQLYHFLAACDRARWSPVVYVSGVLGYWEARIRELGIPIVLLQGNPLAKMLQFRRACIAHDTQCFFSWSSYTNGYGLALLGCGVHRIGSFRNALFADLPQRLGWLWSWMSLAGIDAVVCNSHETETQLHRRVNGAKTVAFVPNVITIFSDSQLAAWRDDWRARLRIGSDAVLVTGVGRLAPQKNFARFIDVIAEVRKDTPVQAVIAGEDLGCLAVLEAQRASSGLEQAVRFIGPVTDARELIAASDIFLLTSDCEGTPNVLLEAMAAGVPCVATRINGINERVVHGDTGYLGALNASELAEHVRRLSADPALRQRIGARARRAVAEGPGETDTLRRLWEMCERGGSQSR